MKNRWKFLLLPIITLILEILPYGAVLNFMLPATDGSVGHFRELYSYFDLVPFGWANFAPFITAVISCVTVLLVLIYCVTGKEAWAKAAKAILCVCAIISFGPLLYGIRYFSVVGLVISLSLIGEYLVLYFSLKKEA